MQRLQSDGRNHQSVMDVIINHAASIVVLGEKNSSLVLTLPPLIGGILIDSLFGWL